MKPSTGNGPAPALAADEQYQNYKRLVSVWIENFLQDQKDYVAQMPSLDTDELKGDKSVSVVDAP